MSKKENEQLIDELARKHTRKVTGSIYLRELKQNNFVTALTKNFELSIRGNPDATPAKIRMLIQSILRQNCSEFNGGMHETNFDAENFKLDFLRQFQVKRLNNEI